MRQEGPLDYSRGFWNSGGFRKSRIYLSDHIGTKKKSGSIVSYIKI